MADDRTVTVRMRAEFGSYLAGLRAAAAETKALTKATGEFDRVARQAAADNEKTAKRVEDSNKKMGQGLLAAGAVGALGIGLVVGASADFEQAVSAIRAATHGTAKDMQLLSDAAVDAGAKTVFSATEAAGAIEELAKAGLSTRDVLGGGLQGSLALAAAGGLEVADAAGAMANALAQFRRPGADAAHVADLLAAGAGKAQGSVGDMAYALRQSGGVAAQMGLSLEDTVGALAEFAHAGYTGQDAGTSFKQMLLSLVPNSEQASKTMDTLGLSFFDATGQIKPFSEIAGELQTKLGGLTQEQQATNLKTLFGADAYRVAAVALRDGAAGATEWRDKVNDAGYAAETAALRLDNLKGDLEQLSGAINSEFIQAGDGATGTLRGMTQAATGTVQLFGELPGPAKATAGGLFAASTAATALAGAFILGAPKVDAFRKSIDTMGPRSAAFGRGVLGVGRVLGGPWGAALATGTIALGYFAKQHAEAKERVEDFTAAVEADSGALGYNARERAAYYADQQGLLEQADKMGVNKEDLVSAILGEADAQERLNAAVKAYVDPLRDYTGATTYGSVEVNKFRGQIDGLTGELQTGADAARRKAEAVGEDATATGHAAAAGGEYVGVLEDTTGALDDATDAVDEYRQALDILNGVNITAFEQEIALQQQLAETRKAVDKNTGGVSLKERSALLDLAKQAGETALAVFEKTGDQDKADRVLERSRKRFLELAEAMGLGEKEARRLRDQVLDVPDRKDTTFRTPGLAKALADGQSLRSLLDGLDGRQVEASVGVKFRGTGKASSLLDDLTRRASGGPYGPGPLLVGEQGPELLWPNRGGYVSNAAETKQMVSGGSLDYGSMVSGRQPDFASMVPATGIPAGGATRQMVSENRTHHDNFGDISIVAHDYDDFRRQLDREQRLKSCPSWAGG